MPANDPINHPSHYTAHPSGIECIQVTEHMNFCKGNAIKYIWRAGDKGPEIQDLKKAIWYIEREIARLEKEDGGAVPEPLFSIEELESVFDELRPDHKRYPYSPHEITVCEFANRCFCRIDIVEKIITDNKDKTFLRYSGGFPGTPYVYNEPRRG